MGRTLLSSGIVSSKPWRHSRRRWSQRSVAGLAAIICLTYPQPSSASAFYTFNGLWTGPSAPYGIAIDTNPNVIYVADPGSSQFRKFTTAGSGLGAWGSAGSGNSQFTDPESVAIDPTGSYVFIAEGPGNHRVQRFDSNGTFQNAWGEFTAASEDGKISLGDLAEYLKNHVSREARRLWDRPQNPVVSGESDSMLAQY